MGNKLLKVLYFGLFGIAVAVAIYWFLQPSDDKISLHPDSLRITVGHSATDTIETKQGPPTSESPERESTLESIEPSSMQVDPVFTVTADAIGDSTVIDCVQPSSLLLRPGLADIPAHLPPFGYHDNPSDAALLERVHADDGYAQQVYANRLQNRLIFEFVNARGYIGQDEERERWLREFDTMEEMAILAIQNRSIVATRLLGTARILGSPREDLIIAIAWLVIEQRMGGQYLASLQSQGVLEITEEQMETSELLADHFIEEYDLWFLSPITQVDSETENIKRQDCIEN